jgi:putative PIN family toxin of toxin-antitoxin system
VIVIDSGTWVSAIRFGGLPRQAILKVLAVDQIAISDFIEAEVIRILEEKFNFKPEAMHKGMQILLEGARRVTIKNEVKGVCRDPKDDHVLECARKAGAQLILTSDNDLLDLGDFEGIRIVNARTYLEGTGLT